MSKKQVLRINVCSLYSPFYRVMQLYVASILHQLREACFILTISGKKTIYKDDIHENQNQTFK